MKSGSFLYGGQVRCPLRVVETDKPPFFVDDDADIRDHPGPWFCIETTAADDPTRTNGSTEGFKTLDEAIASLAVFAVDWDA